MNAKVGNGAAGGNGSERLSPVLSFSTSPLSQGLASSTNISPDADRTRR